MLRDFSIMQQTEPQRIVRSPGKRRRSGTTAVELVVAVTLLAVLTGICGELIVSTVRLRREERKRAWALQEAANVMETLFAKPWDELSVGKKEVRPCSPAGQSVLESAVVRQEVFAAGKGRRLVVTVEWPNGEGKLPGSVSLVAYRFPTVGAPPASQSSRPSGPTRQLVQDTNVQRVANDRGE
jgi:Tfp pilus assembly protein PilE